MNRLRRKIAERLVMAQNNAAMLTTFNEVDMTAVMALRKQYKEAFIAKHGVKLGFMGFFAKAVIEGLKAYPAVNAEIRGEDIGFVIDEIRSLHELLLRGPLPVTGTPVSRDKT